MSAKSKYGNTNVNGERISLIGGEISNEVRTALLGYKVYTALLTQTGTTAPVATVLDNTLGFDVNFEYFSQGYYIITNPENFPVNKTICFATPSDWSGAVYIPINRIDDEFDNIFQIGSLDIGSNYTPTDGKLLNTPIEIRVYN
jgi:hypothetical protein